MFGFGKDKKEKKPGFVKQAIGYQEIKENAVWIKDMAGVLNPNNIKPGRFETFESAVERLQATSESIRASQRNHAITFYLIGVVGFIGVLLNLDGDEGIMSFLYVAAFASLCLAQMFRFAFRTAQIRSRRLFYVSEFFKMKDQWIPRWSDFNFEPEVKAAPGRKVVVRK